MKAFVHYVKGHSESESQAVQALESFRKFKWDAHLVEGITPETLNEDEFDFPLIDGGRLIGFYEKGERTYAIKKSCISNQIRLWRKVVEENETMAFVEHDAIAIGKPCYEVNEVLCLNVDYAFQPPSVLGTLQQFKGYQPPLALSPLPLPPEYPLKYYKTNLYKNCNMIPGTAAYAVSPAGAKKLLQAAESYGIDQSDFFINTYNVRIEYLSPSPVRFNKKNLNLSHKL